MEAAHALHPSRRAAAGREEYWATLALKCCPGLGPAKIKILLEAFGTAKKAFDALPAWSDLGLSPRVISMMKAEAWRDGAREHWEALKSRPDGVLLWGDEAYPRWLKNIVDPPPCIYFLGNLSLLSNICVALVGARDCTIEGLRTTAHIGRGLSDAGITIVSGMAMGIDRAAHLAGLEGVGSSIGVLGTGLAVPYPRDNMDLHALMRARGLLLSEYAPETPGRGNHFIVRNRLISGLSRAVLVTEAATRSGSLNTARHALEQNRELMAVPGPASGSSFRGCQDLIRGGAKPVFESDDVLRELMPLLQEHVRKALEQRDQEKAARPAKSAPPNMSGTVSTGEEPPGSMVFGRKMAPGLLPWKGGTASKPNRESRRKKAVALAPPQSFKEPQGSAIERSSAERVENVSEAEALGLKSLDPEDLERDVLDFLAERNRHVDDICRHLGQNPATISRCLLLLEMRGLARRLPGMVYGLAESGLDHASGREIPLPTAREALPGSRS